MAAPVAHAPTARRARTSCRRNGAALGWGRDRLRSQPLPHWAPSPSPKAPLLPLWYQGRYQGQEMLAVVLGGVSGQQEYLSKVRLHTSSAEAGRAGPLSGAPRHCPLPPPALASTQGSLTILPPMGHPQPLSHAD